MHDVPSLAVYAFGALTFSTLALFYWGQRLRGKRRDRSVFPMFTLICAAAFLGNLVFQTPIAHGAGSDVAVFLLVVRGLATGLLPPLILHLVMESGRGGAAPGRRWLWLLGACYAICAAGALSRVLEGAGLLPAVWSDALFRAPAVALAAAAVLGLWFLIVSPRPPRAADRAHLRWTRALLLLMLVCAAASLGDAGEYVGQLPDYLLLALFCVSLYYRARLVFFDVLLKRGAFLALGIAALIAASAAAARLQIALPSAAVLWLGGLGMLLWLGGPPIYALAARVIDRLWLRRPFSVVEAERQFIRDVQSAATEEELESRAAQSLAAIFQASAHVRFGHAADPAAGNGTDCLSAELERGGAAQGAILLSPRPTGVPFLSDDRRLLQLLTGTLGMVLENVRFRAERRRQAELEQELRLLASRAELKALRAQINPHFLFNALSAISGLMHIQPELADETIERLAEVFRYTLRTSQREWAPLGEEIGFISAYLRIEQVRFGKRLQVDIDVEPAAAPIRIPAMAIQPLVENAIKHGISAQEGPGAVGVRAALADGYLSVEVSDSGPGFPPGFSLDEPSEAHGLRNVAERLRGYYGDSARLSWASGRSGARVILTIPELAACGVAAGEPR